MISRRNFLKKGSLGVLGAILMPQKVWSGVSGTAANELQYISKRPPVADRNFTSRAIEQCIAATKPKIKDPKLAYMFENCFPCTLDTTVNFQMKNGKPDTFVITGDIHAMWLRDSSAQVFPYLAFMNEDPQLKLLIEGVIRRQTEQILLDPYANAFNDGPTGSKWSTDTTTKMIPEVYERKWEIDSLCYPVRLAYYYWKTTGDASIFDAKWQQAAQLIIDTFRDQQRKTNLGNYFFYRVTDRQGDTVLNKGYGSPIKPVGLICSSFRPSDDATILNFLIPSNLFAAESLRQIAEIGAKVLNNNTLNKQAMAFANEVHGAVKKYGIVEHPVYGKVYAYEVDGMGNHLFMDDANVPSLLSLPYLCSFIKPNDPIYLNTRKLVWSDSNPYFFKGSKGEGIGGPHVSYDYVWPMSIIMKAMTSTNPQEIQECINVLVNTDGNTGFMHESFHKDNPDDFTRSWFAWANTLFGELVLREVGKNV
ncbi:MAG: glycoside hydrolase family 125 protein [Bacteroidales bacterium]